MIGDFEFTRFKEKIYTSTNNYEVILDTQKIGIAD